MAFWRLGIGGFGMASSGHVSGNLNGARSGPCSGLVNNGHCSPNRPITGCRDAGLTGLKLLPVVWNGCRTCACTRLC
ncbi:hypothetical protein L207DRAFT_111603 [Hyaloscypha variabilis F]|uniref:Uncharacterized protein n=1 Tax=Hyaloscypha variabilis (strain UAMH 11265 / GT02V1 / F) TaxID=1149755 RepID=A0A2J6R9X2_HYAVF|nr:hypothetical protein L207DRAFT_111603 [Hyaloscypha variabilis F]